MTPYEEKRVREIYGDDYEEIDIPTYIRKRLFDQEMALIDEIERRAEEETEEEKEREEKEKDEQI